MVCMPVKTRLDTDEGMDSFRVVRCPQDSQMGLY